MFNYTSAAGLLTFTPYTVAVNGIPKPANFDPDYEGFPGVTIPAVHERLQEYFTAVGLKARYGTVTMDFPESQPGLILKMVATKLE